MAWLCTAARQRIYSFIFQPLSLSLSFSVYIYVYCNSFRYCSLALVICFLVSPTIIRNWGEEHRIFFVSRRRCSSKQQLLYVLLVYPVTLKALWDSGLNNTLVRQVSEFLESFAVARESHSLSLSASCLFLFFSSELLNFDGIRVRKYDVFVGCINIILQKYKNLQQIEYVLMLSLFSVGPKKEIRY